MLCYLGRSGVWGGGVDGRLGVGEIGELGLLLNGLLVTGSEPIFFEDPPLLLPPDPSAAQQIPSLTLLEIIRSCTSSTMSFRWLHQILLVVKLKGLFQH